MEDLITRFTEITGEQNLSVIKQYLKGRGEDLDLAVALYLSDRESKSKKQSHVSNVAQTNQSHCSENNSSRGQKIMTFSDMVNQQDEQDSGQNNFFAGGSYGSGVQLNDKSSSSDGNLVSRIFGKVRDLKNSMSQQAVEQKPTEFAKGGYRLGDTSYGFSKPIKSVKNAEIVPKTVIFYKNGFLLEGEESELRKYSDPQNAKFLQDLSEGYVPREFEMKYKGSQISLQMIDRKHEDYREPEKVFVPFGGVGYPLSSAEMQEVAMANEPECNLPVQIQVKFSDGSRQSVTIESNKTVAHLRSWIDEQRPNSGDYELIGGFPPRPLNDLNATIHSARLGNSLVSQKCKI